MANHKSALKRSRQSLKRNKVNTSLHSSIKNNITNIQHLISSNKIEEIPQSLSAVNSLLSKGVKKGIIKKKYASRKLSSLSFKIKKI